LDSLSDETRDAIAIAKLGDSDNLELGEPVIAIGNALGYGQSVTNGIVSALNREIELEDGSTGTFIQTNAAINPGNSGGALLNINGEVIGINSNKIGGTTIEGMGYAIPISSASPIIADLMERQTRTKVADDEMGYIGITMQEITEQSMQMYNMPAGVFIYEVQQGSPAEAAGLKRGDIVVKFDGQKITSASDLQNALQYYKAGETTTITVKRSVNGEYESIDLEITLGARTQN
jgi:serine protease Do